MAATPKDACRSRRRVCLHGQRSRRDQRGVGREWRLGRHEWRIDVGRSYDRVQAIGPNVGPMLVEIDEKWGLDAPVSDKPVPISALTVMVGGSDANYARAQPYFECYAKKHALLGVWGRVNSPRWSWLYCRCATGPQ